jgi:hypothetical protein
MKHRLFLLLMIGLLALAVVPAAAQDHEAFAAFDCLGLSEADCAILQEAAENTTDIRSFTQSFDFSASISNASNLVQGIDTAVTATGSGAFFIDETAMSEEAPYAGFSMTMDVSGSATTSDGEQSGDMNFVVADGNLYIQDADSGAWRGSALADLAENPSGMTVFAMPLDQIMGMHMESMDGAMLPDSFDLMALLQTPGFLNQERLADETVADQNMAVFAYTADLGVLLANEDFQAAISEMSAAAGDSEDPMAQQMAMMLPILLENASGTVTLTRWIGVDDELPHRVSLVVDTAIDLGIKSGNGTAVPPIEVKLDFAVDLSDINSTTAPTAPADATIVPANELFPQAEPAPAS